MKKNFFSPVALFALGTLTFFLFSCSKNSDNISIGDSSPANDTIYMKGSAYSIPGLIVGINAKVAWINDDSIVHTVTADDGSFNSGDMNPGSSFVYTFKTQGVYYYHCMHHAGMTGTVTVATR